MDDERVAITMSDEKFQNVVSAWLLLTQLRTSDAIVLEAVQLTVDALSEFFDSIEGQKAKS